jgi:putative restriction endonuclease
LPAPGTGRGRSSAIRGWLRSDWASRPSRPRCSWHTGGEHKLDNGLLLRSDVHTLFDLGYLGVDPGYRLHVSPRLREEFSNGEQFYQHAGHSIALPTHRADLPGGEFLEWHLDTIFRAP